ncbi:MAG: hypothetical protein AB7H93_00400 [Vicinamibacterales bacterium]
MTRLVTIAALVTALGCSSDPPTAPSPSPGSYSGAWSGTATDPDNGSGTLHLELTELTVDSNRSLLGGTWRAEFPTGGRVAAGSVAGLRSGRSVQLTLQPSTPLPCPPGPFAAGGGTYSATDLTASDATIAGPYTYQTCDGSVPGALTVRRQ